MVATDFEMHDARDWRACGCAAVEFDALNERRGAIPDADDRDPDPRHKFLFVFRCVTWKALGDGWKNNVERNQFSRCALISAIVGDLFRLSGYSAHPRRRGLPPLVLS